MQRRGVTDTARDLYGVLGVEPSVSAAGITSAFRRRVRELRPDTQVDAVTAERFGRLMAAYETLRDPVLRAAYDRRHPAVALALAPSPPPAAVPDPAPVPAPPRRAASVASVVVLGVGRTVPRTPPLRVGPVRVERTC